MEFFTESKISEEERFLFESAKEIHQLPGMVIMDRFFKVPLSYSQVHTSIPIFTPTNYSYSIPIMNSKPMPRSGNLKLIPSNSAHLKVERSESLPDMSSGLRILEEFPPYLGCCSSRADQDLKVQMLSVAVVG